MASKLRRTRNATKLRTYRIAMAVTSLLILLEALGAPRKF
jgi:hypothetical protein